MLQMNSYCCVLIVVPKAPPVIISPPVRIFSNEENSIQVKFKVNAVHVCACTIIYIITVMCLIAVITKE